ncbi:MAG: MBL fold metallo-hydrolase [Clostridia bacterium]|nr:MBL fold metallo-hydrolase [Clostridia bacterium]
MVLHTITGGMLEVNCYIIETDAGCIIVDPGVPIEDILSVTKEKKIAAVLLTHGHIDHITALDDIHKMGIPVYISKEDAPMLSDPEKNQSTLFYRVGLTFPPADHLLSEGDHLRLLGLDITVLATPGHTKGSVCFLIDNTLLSGDTLFQGGRGRTDFPGGSDREMAASLRRLKAMPAATIVYPGHGMPTTIGDEQWW